MHPLSLSNLGATVRNVIGWKVPSAAGSNFAFPSNAADLGIKPVRFNGVDAVPFSAQCIRILSDTMTSLPKYAVKKGEYPVKAVSPSGTPHWLSILMDRPHPLINRSKLFRWLGNQVHGNGQGFMIVQRDANGIPIALIPALYAGTLTGANPVSNPVTLDSEVALIVPDEFATGNFVAGRANRVYPMRDVIHVTNGDYDPFTGLSVNPLKSDAHNPVGRFVFLTKLYDDQLARGGYQNVIAQMEKREFDKWSPEYEKRKGLPRIGPYQVFPFNTKITMIGRSPVEQSFLDVINGIGTDICRVFNVPVNMAQVQTKAGQTEKGRPAVEEQFRNFRPVRVRYEHARVRRRVHLEARPERNPREVRHPRIDHGDDAGAGDDREHAGGRRGGADHQRGPQADEPRAREGRRPALAAARGADPGYGRDQGRLGALHGRGEGPLRGARGHAADR